LSIRLINEEAIGKVDLDPISPDLVHKPTSGLGKVMRDFLNLGNLEHARERMPIYCDRGWPDELIPWLLGLFRSAPGVEYLKEDVRAFGVNYRSNRRNAFG